MSRGLIAHVNGYDILTVGDACVELNQRLQAEGWREKFLSDDQNTSAWLGTAADSTSSTCMTGATVSASSTLTRPGPAKATSPFRLQA